MIEKEKAVAKVFNDTNMASSESVQFTMSDDVCKVFHDTVSFELEHMDLIVSDNVNDGEMIDGVGEHMRFGLSILNKLEELEKSDDNMFRISDFTVDELKFLFDAVATRIVSLNCLAKTSASSVESTDEYEQLRERYEELNKKYFQLVMREDKVRLAYDVKSEALARMLDVINKYGNPSDLSDE